MGFLDKAKATATQAMQQGQAKVGQMQQSRQESELYKTLGEAVYQEQRQGGDHAAVEAALTALDTHFAQVAQAAAAAATSGPAAPTQPGGPVAAPTPPSQQATPPAGNFTLDDMQE
jgi:uncharacterized membrane protein